MMYIMYVLESVVIDNATIDRLAGDGVGPFEIKCDVAT